MKPIRIDLKEKYYEIPNISTITTEVKGRIGEDLARAILDELSSFRRVASNP